MKKQLNTERKLYTLCMMVDDTPGVLSQVARLFSRKEKTNCVWEEKGAIYRRGEKLLDTAEILSPGTHNIENYMAAIAAVEGLVEP